METEIKRKHRELKLFKSKKETSFIKFNENSEKTEYIINLHTTN